MHPAMLFIVWNVARNKTGAVHYVKTQRLMIEYMYMYKQRYEIQSNH